MTRSYKKIMIVDDDPIDRFILRRSLVKEKFAFEIIEAVDGVEALEILTNYSVNRIEIPELIFVDVNMPVLNGFGFLNAIHQLSLEYKNRCRIIVVTPYKNEFEKKKAFLYPNVVGYFEKPLNDEALLELKQQLKSTRAS